jgi:hypothetical protein
MEIGDKQKDENSKAKVKKPFKERFLDSWNRVDKKCDHCGAVSVPAVGLNRQNMKRLISFSTNPTDWIVLFMIIMVLVGVWSYNHDLAECKELKQQIESSSLNVHASGVGSESDNLRFLLNYSSLNNNGEGK